MTKIEGGFLVEMKLIKTTKRFYVFELSKEIFKVIPPEAKSVTISFVNEGDINEKS